MKKLITAVIILLIIVALPAITGQYLRFTVQHRINNSKLPNGQELKVTEYHAGWFHSTAHIQVSANPAQKAFTNDQQLLNMDLDITHGPLAISRDMQGRLQWFFGQGFVTGTATMFGSFKMNILAKISYNNNIDLQLTNHNYQYMFKGYQVNVGSFVSHLNVSKKFTAAEGEMNLQNFQIGNAQLKMQFLVSKIDSKFSLMKDPAGLWLGKRATVVPDIAFSEAGLQVFALKGLNINADSEAKDKMVEGKIQINVNKLSPANYGDYGPINFVYSCDNMSLQKLDAFSQFITSADMSVKNPNAEGLRNQMMLYLVDALQGSTQNLNNLSIGTPKGMVTVVGKIVLPKQLIDVHQAASKPMLALLISQMSMRSNSSLKISVPSGLLVDIYAKLGKQNHMESYIKVLKDSGFIVTVNNMDIIDFTYNQGQAMVNNQPIAQVIQRFQQGMQALLKAEPANAAAGSAAVPANVAPGATVAQPAAGTTTNGAVPAGKVPPVKAKKMQVAP